MEGVGGSPEDQQMPLPPISGDVIFNQNSESPVDHDRHQSELTATGISPDNYNLRRRERRRGAPWHFKTTFASSLTAAD